MKKPLLLLSLTLTLFQIIAKAQSRNQYLDNKITHSENSNKRITQRSQQLDSVAVFLLDTSNGQWTKAESNSFKYNENGLNKEQIRTDKIGENLKEINSYNEKNNLVKKEIYEYNKVLKEWEPNNLLEYKYNEENQVFEEKQYSGSSGQWKLSTVVFSYFRNGLKIADTTYGIDPSTNTSKTSSSKIYHYNSNQQLELLEFKNFLFGEWTFSYKETYEYDSSSNQILLEESSFNKETKQWIKKSQDRRYINSFLDGDIIRRTSYTYKEDLQQYVVENSTIYNYDVSILSETINVPDREGATLLTNHKLLEIYFLKDESPDSDTIAKQEFYYSDLTPTNVLSGNNTENFAIFPNPITDRIILSDFNEFKDFMILDISGKVVLFGRINNTDIDCKMLNKGFYLVKIYDKNLIRTARFVKE